MGDGAAYGDARRSGLSFSLGRRAARPFCGNRGFAHRFLLAEGFSGRRSYRPGRADSLSRERIADYPKNKYVAWAILKAAGDKGITMLEQEIIGTTATHSPHDPQLRDEFFALLLDYLKLDSE